MLDLVIKNGRIIDGSGMPGYIGDIAIQDSKIVKLGAVDAPASRIIDATGRVVAPGFIDPHTHFDAQLLWDGAAKPAMEHGVTTIVPGNCSLSLAPLKVADRPRLVGMFNQIEEMPLIAFEEGVTWDWQTFDEFVARIKKGLKINVAPLVGHSALRLWVMGEAATQRVATDEELVEMAGLLTQCLDAGAIGMSTSVVDMDEKLAPVPSRYADIREIDALAAVLGKYGRILQLVNEFYNTDLTLARIDQLADLSLKHQITTTFSPLFINPGDYDNVDRIIKRVEEQFKRGARVWPQVQTRPIDISFCLDVPSLLFIRYPTWYGLIRFGSHDDIKAGLGNEDLRQKLLVEVKGAMPLWEKLVLRQVNTEANKPLVGKTLKQIAELRGNGVIETMIDLSLEENLQAHFLAANMGHHDEQKVGELLDHPNVHIGASDGGAHILSFSTYGDTGYLFSRFVRDKALLSLEAAVKKITSDTANIWGIPQRGLLKQGYIADITIFDAETVDRGQEYFVQDVPGNGSRYVRDAIGIETVIIGGEVSFEAATGYSDVSSGQVLPGASL